MSSAPALEEATANLAEAAFEFAKLDSIARQAIENAEEAARLRDKAILDYQAAKKSSEQEAD